LNSSYKPTLQSFGILRIEGNCAELLYSHHKWNTNMKDTFLTTHILVGTTYL